MVDLPPPVEELNEYGKFAFLNEMYTMASYILANNSDQNQNTFIKFALEAIESERTNLRDIFNQPYQRPQEKTVVALLMRCAELYLQEGQWFNISNVELQLVDKGNEPFMDKIRYSFKNNDYSDRFVLEEPIIKLTFARFKMMTYFEEMQHATYTGPDPDAHDPLSTFIIPAKPIPTDAELYNQSVFIKGFDSPDDLFLTDDEYLQMREEYVWAAFRGFQVVGSFFTLAYFVVMVLFGIKALIRENHVVMNEKAMFTTSLAVGYGILMLLLELLSFRLCFFACCRPKCHMCCIYPGIAMYFIQYGASWVASALMMCSLFLYSRSSSDIINILILQHTLATILPIFFTPCIFKWNRRVERKFKWVRIGFFRSCWWVFVQIIFCLLFTPGIHGIQFIISTGLKNHPKVSTSWKKRKNVLTP
ncbi:hypothetical protein TRFO_04983 [Tritrichomonas foetus]|uniref:Uncharacterized protein n=1 Tax=Tritrichomonas foetus TaxID=1144522 RepID=A0A1J4KA81_9EUKA|nr:hypothetical protein TRFO_04983 [Tritrichomonas foetus]|eukprot:OHT08345.1 hypothetical protein TRFO_04983 [Tritrichomonas foetus]